MGNLKKWVHSAIFRKKKKERERGVVVSALFEKSSVQFSRARATQSQILELNLKNNN